MARAIEQPEIFQVPVLHPLDGLQPDSVNENIIKLAMNSNASNNEDIIINE